MKPSCFLDIFGLFICRLLASYLYSLPFIKDENSGFYSTSDAFECDYLKRKEMKTFSQISLLVNELSKSVFSGTFLEEVSDLKHVTVHGQSFPFVFVLHSKASSLSF